MVKDSKQGSVRFGRLLFVSLLLLAVAGSIYTPAGANPLLERGLRKGLEFLLMWEAGHIVDKALGLDCQRELETIKSSLEEEIRSSGDSREEMAAELQAVQSMLVALQKVMSAHPTAVEVEELKRRVAADIQNMLDIQKNHESRLEQLEEAQARDKASTQDILTRLKALEEEMALRSDGSSVGKTPSEVREREWESLPPHRRPPHRTGVTLNLVVKGADNQVWVLEAEKGGQAHVGNFEIKRKGAKLIYWLSWGTGAVLSITGVNNTICIQKEARARVRVRNLGEHTRINQNCQPPLSYRR